MSSSGNHNHDRESTGSSFGDKTVSTNVFAEIDYLGSRVYVYGSMANDVANKQEPFKWIFYYLPLFLPVKQQSLSDATDWIGLTKYNKLKICVAQGNGELEMKIRDSLAKKVDKASSAYASSWTIKPLMIDSFTAYIVEGDNAVPGIESCKVVNPNRIEIQLSFSFLPSVDEQFINEVLERIRQGDYQIKLSIIFAGFSKISQNVVSYSYESIHDAVSSTLANGPADSKHILRSQKSSFIQGITERIQKTVVIENKAKVLDEESLRLTFTKMIEASMNKAEELKIEMGQLANVWSADDLKPDFIESEVNKLFKHNQSETSKKKDGNNYFELDKSHLTKNDNETSKSKVHDVNGKLGGQIPIPIVVKAGYKYNKSSAENFVSELHDEVKKTNKDKFSESDIKKILERNSVEVEWKGAKFVPKSIRVIKIADIRQNIRTSLVSKQIELEKEKGTSIIVVNHNVILDSELEYNVDDKGRGSGREHSRNSGVNNDSGIEEEKNRSNVNEKGKESDDKKGSIKMSEYTVKTGDYLWKIAQENGTTMEAILEKNPQIKNPDMIYPGQKLTL